MRRFRAASLVVAVSVVVAWSSAPLLIEPRLNSVRRPAPPPPSARAAALFSSLRTADLHADSLLWRRDLLTRSRRGQVDVPRLLQGRSALQVFGLVTQVPYPLRAANGTERDALRWLAPAEFWPLRAWRSPLQRALYQAARLAAMADRSGGRLALVRSAADLRALRSRQAAGEAVVGAILATEGAQCLEGRLENLDSLFAAGVRMGSPSHFTDTQIGGSAHGRAAGGLTELGRKWLAEMERRKMIVDVAHASPKTVADVLRLAKRPVVVSHTGVRATCDNKRNLSDDQLRAVAKNGGLVGIGYWKLAVCGDDAAAAARAIKHAVDVMGAAHVALGSDFDGAVTMPFDASRLDALVSALLDAGLSDSQVRAVMGENVLRFLDRQLPP